MKRISLYTTLIVAGLFALNSCAFFELDNYDAPEETLKGRVIDMDGNPVLTDQGSEGIRVRLMDLEWEKMGNNVTPQDFYCMMDGTFQNTKLFSGEYNVTVDGPFVPLVMDDANGVPIKDESQTVNINGVTEIEFQVQPFLKVEFVNDPTVADGIITATVRVTRAISREELADAISPTGDWSDSYANVTDIQLFVSYSSTVGYRARDEYWSGSISYSGNAFDSVEGQAITITSNTSNPITSGRHLYIRAAARIGYETASVARYNYSEVMEVLIP